MSDRFDERVDVVIIGSGPTGATYARTLADEAPSAKILMVEAGPIISDPPGMHVANILDNSQRAAALIASQGPNRKAYDPMNDAERLTRMEGGPDHSMLRRPGLFTVGGGTIDGDEFPAAHAASNVGGMGAHWFGACPRPSESERVPFIERTILDEALGRAERLLKVSNTQFPDSPISGRLEAILSDLYDSGRPPDRRVGQMPMAVVRTNEGVVRSGPGVIMGDLLTAERDTFELRPETVCRRIVMEGDRAVGVELWSPATNTSTVVRAGAVVVAADALHTPQLLYASGIRPPALGHNLNEHPQLSVMAEFDAPDGDTRMQPEQGDVGVLADTQILSRASSGVSWIPYIGEEWPFHVQISHVEPVTLGTREREIARVKPILSISFFLPSDIQWDNAVSFSDTERDWCGRPKVRLRFRFSEGDKARMREAGVQLMRICNAVGRPLDGHKPRTPPHGSSLHYQGTIRMGERDDGQSVCDQNSRVWGTRNVYVAGNGVIPTVTAGNPTLTSVALATLGARAIASELSPG